MTALPAVTINIKESPDGSAEKVYTVPPYGSTGQQVKLTREENPPESGFLMFKHTSPNGQPFQVQEVKFGATPVPDIGVNSNDEIEHLAVWYWRETLETMTNPLLVEVKRSDGNFIYNYNKGGMETSWTSLPLRPKPLTIQLTDKTLETQLDDLNCYLNNAVTLNLTFQNSQTHNNRKKYCCYYHKNTGEGKVSVTLVTVSCKEKGHKSADCYKHVNTDGSRVAAIKYDPTDGTTRNRINLNGHKSPPSVTTVYAFYKNHNPKLIYVDGGAATGWYKKPTSSDKDEQWQKVSTNLDGITPDNLTENMDCENWTKLKEALKEAKCGSYPQCPTTVAVKFEPKSSSQSLSGSQGHVGNSGAIGGNSAENVLRSIIEGLFSGLGKVASNKQLLENLVDFGKSGSDFVSKTGIDTIGAALEITEEVLKKPDPPQSKARGPVPETTEESPVQEALAADRGSSPAATPRPPQAVIGLPAGVGMGVIVSSVFGGSGAAGFLGYKDVGRYTITADSYIYDINKNFWSKLHIENAPSPRAAHAAACVETMQVVVFGGATGGGALSSDDLYLLDLRREKQLSWIIVPTTGPSPGRRYGHTMVFAKPNLVVIGGNDGQRATNDVWYLNVEQSPFSWTEVSFAPSITLPPKRVYHSAELCCSGIACGMIVIFGGRNSESKSLNDTWGLRRHRDGSWDWIEAPVKLGSLPESRYQHASAFIGNKLVIIGGRNDSDINRGLPVSIYDTETLEWFTASAVHRFRHTCWNNNGNIYIFGGFLHQTQKNPTSELKMLDCDAIFNEHLKSNLSDPAIRDEIKVHQVGVSAVSNPQNYIFEASPVRLHEREIRLSSHAHAVQESVSDFSLFVRKISIDKLEDEGKKINKPDARAKLSMQSDNTDTLYDRIIMQLLNVRGDSQISYNQESMFPIPWKDINTLCSMVYQIIKQEDTVLTLRAPIKIYGDIHGQYNDLMRLFRLYKCPLDEYLADSIGAVGDIDSNDYLFLGDYVDRGSNSLEVIVLLFALKCKYPTQVHLIRGNHEDPAINSVYGFQDECKRRLREDPANLYSCWQNINKVFEMLPLGALIEGKILCVHGGIGKSIHKVEDIERIKRPVNVVPIPTNERDQIILDLLWSDPTDSDTMLGTVPNEVRDPERVGHIVKFGPDRVEQFLMQNNLQLIIRAHECVMDGFERFAGGRLITLFSATNYCNHHKNAGALLFIRRDLTIVPKLIYPSTNFETWDMRMAEIRPPTPPRNMNMPRDLIIDPP
ncbi:Ser/Thr protein phosphatase family member protein [Theileria equi strain WA]|uniref:Serine/threonine-protein phosphatase n=1 Tax=Theileria equi strain WA TaxID=1537102 RepID=L0B2N9_THEEQ|nr:Ser/Thr protein phosphatase family member protein [Theileria equi strain WA]AFZ81481.1 Ser/Thr protein phosphatase family member protein [Theileria equi strain WA]|eukprot:XP_004831147.1 Ser/Thr protein phosphatase family member protein [Theileria equi strain WA]